MHGSNNGILLPAGYLSIAKQHSGYDGLYRRCSALTSAVAGGRAGCRPPVGSAGLGCLFPAGSPVSLADTSIRDADADDDVAAFDMDHSETVPSWLTLSDSTRQSL